MTDTAPIQDDASRKRPLESGAEGDAKRPALADGVDEIALKVLVSNGDAGAVIGKGGSVISQIQQESQAKVKMSQSGDFFPGTGDRVILITGTSTAVYEALSLIVTKISSTDTADAEALVIKLPVPNSAGGGIIGKGGSTIRSISETSGAKVQLSQKDDMHPQLNERLCTISGSSVQVLQAGQQVLLKLQEGDCSYTNMSTNYSQAMAGAGMGRPGAMPMGYGGVYGQQPMMATQAPIGMMRAPAASYGMQPSPAPSYGGTVQGAGGTTVTMSVPDAQVGIIVGKGGSTIQAMQAQTGARVNVSQRDGSGAERTITISGEPTAVANAQMMVSQKLQEGAAQQYQ